MKLNSNMFLSAALLATMSIMVACAPAKRGAKFDDRTGNNSGGTEAERAFGTKTVNSPENQAFRDTIISIEAKIEEATDDDESIEKLEALEAHYVAQGMSGLNKVNPSADSDEDDEENSAGLRGGKVSSNQRARYVMSVHVNLAEIGILDFVGVAERFGNAKALQTLTLLPVECKTKFDKNLKVRAICNDKACSKLLVQVVKKGEPGKHLVVNEVLGKKAPSVDKTVNDQEIIETIFTALDRTEELQGKAKILNQMAICKDEAALAAEAKAKEDADAKDAQAKVDQDAKAKEDAEKKAESDSAADTLAGLPE